MKIEIVGSFLPSDTLYEARNDFNKGIIDRTSLKNAEDEAVAELVERQLNLGLTQVTSGELRRNHWDKDFWFGLAGISVERLETGRIYQNVESGSDLMRVSGRIGFNQAHPFFDDMRFLKSRVGSRAVCLQCVPSPCDLYLEILLQRDDELQKIYPAREALLHDIATAYNLTLHELYGLGCRSVQFDDTACGRLCQDNFTKRLLQGGFDLIAIHSDFISLLNDSFAGLPRDMETSLYLSGGDMIVPEWEYIEYPDNIMPKVLRGVNADKFYLPLELGNDYQLEILRHLPHGKKAVLGLVNAHTPFPEPLEMIHHAAALGARYVSPENLSVSPRTGFKLTDHIDRGLTYESQWQKLSELKASMSQELIQG